MITKKDGLTAGQLITILQKVPKDKPIYVASDEEQNTLFKGMYLEHYDDSVVIAGLSGCEVDD